MTNIITRNRIKLISDGKPFNTNISYDDNMIGSVQSAKINMTHNNYFPILSMNLVITDFDIKTKAIIKSNSKDTIIDTDTHIIYDKKSHTITIKDLKSNKFIDNLLTLEWEVEACEKETIAKILTM